MQNKNKLIIFLITLVFLIVALFLIKSVLVNSPQGQQTSQARNDNDKTVANGDDSANKQVVQETDVKGSIFDLIKLGNTQKCTFSNSTDSTSVTGTTYISGKNLRGDYEVTMPDDKKVESHMVSDGEWIYTWTSAMPQGFKMKMDQADAEKLKAEGEKVKGMENLQNNFDFKCSNWISDSSMFAVPTDIQFTDFSELLKGLGGDNSSMCSACNMAPDEKSKTECKTRLGCN